MASRSYHYKGGETDLVMRDAAGAPVFVELHARVARFAQRFGRVAASVTSAKQRRLIAAAKDFFTRQVEDVPTCRFDVIAIDGMRIEWMRGTFGVDA